MQVYKASEWQQYINQGYENLSLFCEIMISMNEWLVNSIIPRFLNKKLFPYPVDGFIEPTSNNDHNITK